MRRLIATAFPVLALLAACEAEAAGPARTEFALANGLRVRLVPAPGL